MKSLNSIITFLIFCSMVVFYGCGSTSEEAASSTTLDNNQADTMSSVLGGGGMGLASMNSIYEGSYHASQGVFINSVDTALSDVLEMFGINQGNAIVGNYATTVQDGNVTCTTNADEVCQSPEEGKTVTITATCSCPVSGSYSASMNFSFSQSGNDWTLTYSGSISASSCVFECPSGCSLCEGQNVEANQTGTYGGSMTANTETGAGSGSLNLDSVLTIVSPEDVAGTCVIDVSMDSSSNISGTICGKTLSEWEQMSNACPTTD